MKTVFFGWFQKKSEISVYIGFAGNILCTDKGQLGR